MTGWDYIIWLMSHQDSEIEAPAASRGKVLAQIPRNKVSIWNKYQFNEMWGVGLGFVAQY